jgi:proteasome accessory factor BC
LTHDADKLIRQLSLVAYLMAEQRPITARDVKSNVEGYANMGDEAFARRFFADRTELKGLGVPIDSMRDEFTGEELYNLREEQYFLPPVDLSDDELAALQTSLHLLEGQFAYAEPLRLALQNLALGRASPLLDPGPKTATVELLGSRYTPEVAQRLAKLEQAISKQRTVRFTYWTIATDSEATRRVNPYGLWELNGVWYMVGDDLERPADDPERRRTFRVSRIRGEITFATRRERDFRMPEDFNVTAYRDRVPWMLGREPSGEATIAVSADATFWVDRLFGRHGDLDELDDGTGRLTTPYSDLAALSSWILSLGGQVTPLAPPELLQQVTDDLRAVAARHEGPPTPTDPVAAPEPSELEPRMPDRGPGPVAPERFALLQALLAYLLDCCGDEPSASVSAAELRERFRLSPQELQDHLDLLNLVNFGGGCYAVYCSTVNGSVQVDKELYGDTFRRPARLSPLEAKALLRALDVVAPLVAAEAHTSLDTVRAKVEGAFGRFPLADTPAPQHADAEETAVTVLNEGVRNRKLVAITYLSRSSSELSTRTIEPYLLRRDERGWYVEAFDRSKGARRTFKVAYIKDASLLDERYQARQEMIDLDQRLGGVVGLAHVRFAPERARWELEGRRGAHPTADGGAVATITYGSRDWLIPEILRYRGHAEVLGPPALREQVRQTATARLSQLLSLPIG